MSKDLYKILGIKRSASLSEIKSAYRKLAIKYHPDKTRDESYNQRFLEIKQAYEILSDEYKRGIYDLTQDIDFDEINQTLEEERRYTRRPPPPFVIYQSQQVEFSARTYFYGFLFVLGIIALSIALPFILMTRSANIHYEKGLAYYKAEMYSAAIDNFTKAVNDLGGKSGIANYYNAYILFNKYGNYRITLKYINESLEDIENDSILSELYWMKGRCYQEANLFDEALSYYEKVGNYSLAYDSTTLNEGIIYTVNKKEYELGIQYLDSLLNKNSDHYVAKYFKAYGLQKLDRHIQALELLEELEKSTSNPSYGSVLFRKAISEINLSMNEKACLDLYQAMELNVEGAKKLYSIYCD